MIKLILSTLMLFLGFIVSAQNVLGKWKTFDDKTGIEKSIVEIYQENHKIYGKITQIIDKAKEDKKCIECEGSDKNQPVLGMVIIKNLEKNGKTWEGGTILDPETGKVYKCYITLENKDKLKVRGYIGLSLLGRTQYWIRI